MYCDERDKVWSCNTVLKNFILKSCKPRLQHKIRRFYVARQVINNRGSSETEIRVLKFLVSSGDSVIDVGANVGAYTKELASLAGPRGWVYAFEPVSENYDILVTVIRKACLSNVRSFHAALGLKSGYGEVTIPDLEGFRGYYWAHLAKPGDLGRREKVEVFALDELWKTGTVPHIDFVKCDVEGGELEVIQGGIEVVRSQCPGWLLEVSRQGSSEVFQLLRGLGYRAFVYDNKLIQTECYRDKEFSNYFFLHPESKMWRRILPMVEA
jgi:FkbM family methyltransferase